MRKKLIDSSCMIIGSLFASSAHAVPVIITGAAGTFGDGSVTCTTAGPCSFTRSFEFVTPAGFNLTSVISTSVATSALTNIDFTSFTLNGVNFDVLSMGTVEIRSLLNQRIIPGGNNVINVTGMTGGDAAFSGNLSFAAVPEPETWLVMLLGMGAIGFAMRRRKSQTLRVRYT